MTTFASANRKGCLDLWSCHLALKKTEASFAFFTRLIGALDESTVCKTVYGGSNPPGTSL